MSTIGRRSSADAAPSGHEAGPPTTNTPYWLLLSTGIVAFVLAGVAFVLWGLGGAGAVFDMIVAFCT